MLEASLGTFPFPIMAHGRALRERLTEAFPELDEQTFIIAQEHVVALVEKHLSGSLQQQRSFAKEPSGLAAGLWPQVSTPAGNQRHRRARFLLVYSPMEGNSDYGCTNSSRRSTTIPFNAQGGTSLVQLRHISGKETQQQQ